MRLYLSSYRIQSPKALEELIGKPLTETSVALIPNAQDYYSKRPWDIKVGELVAYMQKLGLHTEIIDLREYTHADELKAKLATYDLAWAAGGNTYMLRYEMRRSGFETIIGELLNQGMVYGGDSAGALVAGTSIAGVELADEPDFAETVINDGLSLVPFAILPHVDNPEFVQVMPVFRDMHKNTEIIELKDSQAVVFRDNDYRIVDATPTIA